MARKLIYGNEILGFTPSTGILTAKGYVPGSKLLLVNNSTNNTTLFNFSDPDTVAVCTYNSTDHTTTIDLNYNTSSMSASDDLQIYYESESVEIAPVDTLLDPVSKFRVSEPESLIDTDFEYSIQQTKWETAKLTNNIPTSYSLAATTNDPIVVSTASVDNNSDLVQVVTAEDHNLVAGSVIEITGLTDPSYEGTFVVTKVSSTKDFNFKVRFKSTAKKELSTIYSLLYPGAFYTGSGINVLDITTNAAVASTLTVTLAANHGFADNTKLYLKKSRATKLFKINSPTDVRVGASTLPATAGTAQTTQYSLINGSTTTGDNRYYAVRPIVIDDWNARQEINIPATAINTTNGVITFTSTDQIGVAAATTVVAGDAIAFYTPIGNTLPGGITSFRGYYVFQTTAETDPVSGVTTSTIRFSDSWGSTTPTTPSSTGNTLYGNHRIIVGKRVSSIATNDRITFTSEHGFSVNQRLIAISSGTFSNVAKTTNNHNSSNYTYYFVKQIISPTIITVSTTAGGSAANINSSSSTFTPAASNICMFAAADPCPVANGFYLPPQAGFSTIPWRTGSYLLYRASGGVGYNQLGLTTNTRYLVREINNNPNWYNLCLNTNTAINTPINITFVQTNAGNIYNGIHTFITTYPIPDASSIEIANPPKGDFANNELIQYSPDVGITTIGNLIGNALYRVKVNDSNMVLQPGISTLATKFRLSETSSETKVYGVAYTKNTNYMDIYVNNTSVVGYGISAGKMIQVSGVNDTLYNNNLINGLHYVTGISTATSGTWKNKPRIRVLFPLGTYKNQFNTFSIAANATSLQNSAVTGIVSFSSAGGIGTHRITLANDGAADDIYLTTNTIGTSFTLSSNVEIPEVVKTIQGGDSQTVGLSTNWIKLTSHNYADGTQVSYATTGTAISGLTNGGTYYVRVLDRNFIGLATDQEVAINRDNEDSGLIIFASAGSSVPHSFTSNSVKGFITGPGTIGFSTTSTLITGTSTKFLSDFSLGDLFRVYTLTAGNTGPGSYFESRIVKINSNTALRILDFPQYTAGSGSANYFVPTRLYPISDSRIVHRPFDGGVNMSAGLIPNTQVIRQSRRYFRYQSGKGIQLSVAINFNPTFDIDTFSVDGTIGVSTVSIVKCKFPHGLSPVSIGSSQKVKISGVEGPYASNYNGLFDIADIVDDFKFKIAFPSASPADPPNGFPQFNVVNWGDATVKVGMFDDQNGFFFKYDGSTLYAVRRTSTQQIAGSLIVNQTSQVITGTDTQFTRQLSANDKLVLRGQTYKVIQVLSDDEIHVQPSYRGASATNVVGSIVKDIEVPQSQWNLDKCDGTGRFGYTLDINKIQMAYVDYSWYGAGKVRFGFKDQIGEVKYVHEFIHNNKLTESYFRSGNLPTRYEIETFDNPLFSPSLFHWGASVIMDGKFDDDKAYLFTADSYSLPFTNGGLANYNGTRPVGSTSVGSTSITAINSTEAGVLAVGEEITIDTATTAQQYPAGTKIVGIEIDQSSTANKYTNVYKLLTSNPANWTQSSKALNVTSGTSEALRSYIPLVSIRLAPSVDNGIIGNLGYRDIITRMQLNLKSTGVITTHDCECILVLNPQLTNDVFAAVGNPSLSQIYKHEVGDTYNGGTVIYSFRAAGGSVLNSVSGKRGLNNTTVELNDVALLGNSVLGGDLTFPDGPDVLTVAIRPIDTSQITGSSPLIASARITWTEAQA